MRTSPLKGGRKAASSGAAPLGHGHPAAVARPTPDSSMTLSSRGADVPSCGPGRSACGPEQAAGGAGRLPGQVLRRPRPGLAPRCLRSGPWAAGQRSAPRGLAPRVPAFRALGNGSEVSAPRPCPSGACTQGPGQQVRGQLPAAALGEGLVPGPPTRGRAGSATQGPGQQLCVRQLAGGPRARSRQHSPSTTGSAGQAPTSPTAALLTQVTHDLTHMAAPNPQL